MLKLPCARTLLVLAAASLAAACGGPTPPSPTPPSPTASPSPPAPTSGLVTAVTCSGGSDVTAPLQAAVDGGGTVAISAGTCSLSSHIVVHSSVTIRGAGSTLTFLVQHGHANIFDINADNVTVSDMNLDTATFNPGPPIPKNPKPGVLFSNANNTTVTNVTGEAASGFGMRFVGPNPCYTFQRGGTVLTNINMTTTGTGGFAAVDVDCQNHAKLTAITIHGGILALFNDEFTTLNGETFTPGPFAQPCAPPWYVTGPAHDITVENVASHGGRGVVANRPKGPAYNITVANQTVDGSGC
jgi:hypothetical protein